MLYLAIDQHGKQLTVNLEHRDLHMLTLEPVEKSDGPLVFRQLEETRRRTGLVRRAF